MANKKFSELDTAGALTGAEVLAVSQVGISKKSLLSAIKTFLDAATATLTNKTFDTAGAGNVFKIAGVTVSAVTGTGSNVMATTPTLVTPVLGVATATSVNKVTITAPATSATLTLANGSSLVTSGAFSSTFTMTGTTALTFPTTGTLASLAGAEALTNKTYNGNTFTSGSGTLTIAAAKTITVNNTLTLAGTDSTTMTFPTTSATIARTDAANTFAGTQTFSGNLVAGSVGTSDFGAAANSWKRIYIDYTNTATVGAVTINKAAGRVNIAAAGTSVVVTNSLVTANSHVMVVMSTADTTGRVTSVVPAAGSFTINTVAVSAQASFDFFVINAD